MKKSLGAKTFVYPAPVLILGSYDKAGMPNVMTAAWGGICCSKPPCVTVSIRKERHSFGAIAEHKAYTINIASENYVAECDYFGIVSGKNKKKLAETGLTPVKSDLVDAPYISEFPIVLECKLIKTIDLGAHTQFIGEIVDTKVDENILNDKGLPDMKKLKPIIFAPELSVYYGLGDLLGKAFSIGKKFV